MGRYFPFHCHPLTWSEVTAEIGRASGTAADAAWTRLVELGGFPEPFLSEDPRFWRRWKNLRWTQLFREDLRDLSRSLELDRIESLGTLLLEQATGQCNWSRLAARLQVSQDSIARWVSHLEALRTIYLLRPWSRNIARSILKEPRVFFTDWSWIADPGARAENFMGSQILALLELWNDLGLGEFGLHYLRDKDGHEADLLISRGDEPWMALEVKKSSTSLAPGFVAMAEKSGAKWNFQLVVDLAPVEADPFSRGPAALVVPARTFLDHLRPDL